MAHPADHFIKAFSNVALSQPTACRDLRHSAREAALGHENSSPARLKVGVYNNHEAASEGLLNWGALPLRFKAVAAVFTRRQAQNSLKRSAEGGIRFVSNRRVRFQP